MSDVHSPSLSLGALTGDEIFTAIAKYSGLALVGVVAVSAAAAPSPSYLAWVADSFMQRGVNGVFHYMEAALYLGNGGGAPSTATGGFLASRPKLPEPDVARWNVRWRTLSTLSGRDHSTPANTAWDGIVLQFDDIEAHMRNQAMGLMVHGCDETRGRAFCSYFLALLEVIPPFLGVASGARAPAPLLHDACGGGQKSAGRVGWLVAHLGW
ncbi:hypothetical protein DL765_011316 [Monosporascus sp. GIB2]|nr:hypothetical protein DL765_011316 [Monosporascus sp. GIB2]